MDFQWLLDYCRIKAISVTLNPTEVSTYDEICRTYSETFSTPLKEVYDIDPEFVIIHVLEHQLKDFEVEKNINILLDQLYRFDNPNFDADQEEELQKYIKTLEKENEENAKEEIEEVIDEPKGGSVNFSHLTDED